MAASGWRQEGSSRVVAGCRCSFFWIVETSRHLGMQKSVIPAKAGIQAIFEVELKTNLDSGLRRNDERGFVMSILLLR